MKLVKFRMTTAVLAILCGAGSASAQSTTPQTFALTRQPTEQIASYFNSNLGILNSITFSFRYSDQGPFSITSTDPNPVSIDSSFGSTLIYDNFGGGGNAGLIAAAAYQVNEGFSTYAPGETKVFLVFSGIISGSYVDTDANDLAAFISTNATSFLFTPYITASTSTSGAVNRPIFTDNVVGSGTLSLVYNYETAPASAFPEAATWAMMIVGLGVVGASLRRRRSPPLE